MLEFLFTVIKKECIHSYLQFSTAINPYILLIKNYLNKIKSVILKIEIKKKTVESWLNKYYLKIKNNKIYSKITLLYMTNIPTMYRNIKHNSSVFLIELNEICLLILQYLDKIVLLLFQLFKKLLLMEILFLKKTYDKFVDIKKYVITHILPILKKILEDFKHKYTVWSLNSYFFFKKNKYLYREYNQSIRLAISLFIWYFDTEWFQRFLNFMWKYVNYIILRVHFHVIMSLIFFHFHRLMILAILIIISINAVTLISIINISQHIITLIIILFIYILIKLFNTNIYINLNKLTYYNKIKKYIYLK